MTLKEKLLKTGYFIDNEYLANYLNLISSNVNINNEYTEKHHIIPVAVYKIKEHCKTRAEALKYADADSNNSTILLSYINHCLAHCLLYFCSIGRVKYANARTVILMTKHISKMPSIYTSTFEDISAYLLQIKNDSTTNYFSQNEDQFLIDNYYSLGLKSCANILNRPIGSISCRAKYLGIKSKTTYTKEQKQFLIDNYAKYGSKYCAEFLGRSIEAVQKYAEVTLHISGPKKTKAIYCLELKIIFESALDASIKLNISRTSLTNCLKKRSKTADGYHWIYYNKEEIANEERSY